MLPEITAVGKATMKIAVPSTKEQKPSGLMIARSPMMCVAAGLSFAKTDVDVKTSIKVSRTINIFFIVVSPFFIVRGMVTIY